MVPASRMTPLLRCCLRRTIPLGLLALLSFTAIPISAQSVVDPDLDSDGDGIVNAFDPDDDNDGVTDDVDPAPFDAAIPGSAPPPSSIDPDADSDNDGIANSHDPDDDNDSWVDASDPVVFDSDNTLPSSGNDGDGGGGGGAGSGGGGGTVGSSGSAASRSQTATTTTSSTTGARRGNVAITGLPNTGHGRGDLGHSAISVFLAASASAILTLCALVLHRTAGSGCVPVAVRRQRIPVMRR